MTELLNTEPTSDVATIKSRLDRRSALAFERKSAKSAVGQDQSRGCRAGETGYHALRLELKLG
jgi:hypothetical protein